ncbi:hypothetical protein FOZ60_007763 [Perkinsus olseni]|uniref:Uncharacterized protein n=2 Tax=Perkinsus olseni TaxID=32597 RepID=A0A7J6PEA5_PEROL|nr:hypothetical protein FOZ60_007763 [Perkinsus olseni]
MVPGERSVEGRRKNRARYRAKRARAAETDRPIPPLPVASSTSSPQHDDAVRAKAEAWVRRPEVRNFLLRYEQASRLEQTEMANKWVALGIECESEQLAATLARLLESTGLGSSETLLQSASPISPIRGRLLESRVTWPGEGPEDCGIAAVAMSGMPLGLSVPFPEDLRTWPAFHEQSLRPGEPEVIRWKGLPDSDLLPLVRKPMTASWLTYSMSRYSANVVWKDPAHSKIRIIKNYRTSGVNHASRMLTAALYPGLPQIRLLLRENSAAASVRASVSSPARFPPPIAGIRNVTADVISRSARTCYIVLTAARSIIIICYAASDITSGTVREYTSAVRTMGVVRTGKSIPPEGEALISRALASADRILLDKDKPKKQAAPLCQECLQSLADMQLTPGGLRDQLRSAVLVASIFMLRFDQLPGLIRADISWESSSEGLLVSVIFHDTKTASREERQTLCFVEGRDTLQPLEARIEEVEEWIRHMDTLPPAAAGPSGDEGVVANVSSRSSSSRASSPREMIEGRLIELREGIEAAFAAVREVKEVALPREYATKEMVLQCTRDALELHKLYQQLESAKADRSEMDAAVLETQNHSKQLDASIGGKVELLTTQLREAEEKSRKLEQCCASTESSLGEQKEVVERMKDTLAKLAEFTQELIDRFVGEGSVPHDAEHLSNLTYMVRTGGGYEPRHFTTLGASGETETVINIPSMEGEESQIDRYLKHARSVIERAASASSSRIRSSSAGRSRSRSRVFRTPPSGGGRTRELIQPAGAAVATPVGRYIRGVGFIHTN